MGSQARLCLFVYSDVIAVIDRGRRDAFCCYKRNYVVYHGVYFVLSKVQSTHVDI